LECSLSRRISMRRIFFGEVLVSVGVVGSYIKKRRRCGGFSLAGFTSSELFADGGGESRRLRRPVLRPIGLKPSPPFGSEPQGRRQPSFTTAHCPTSLGVFGKRSPLCNFQRRSDMRGCEGPLRSSLGSKVLSVGRRRRGIFLLTAEGLPELEQASQTRWHRERVFIYESAISTGTNTFNDKAFLLPQRPRNNSRTRDADYE
jgi:hypothetical protein